jgi:hypothetical protein
MLSESVPRELCGVASHDSCDGQLNVSFENGLLHVVRGEYCTKKRHLKQSCTIVAWTIVAREIIFVLSQNNKES